MELVYLLTVPSVIYVYPRCEVLNQLKWNLMHGVELNTIYFDCKQQYFYFVKYVELCTK